jgi:hypothetical protein
MVTVKMEQAKGLLTLDMMVMNMMITDDDQYYEDEYDDH